MDRRTFLALGGAFALSACATGGVISMPANTTLIVLRHGDRDDENLSAKGRARAAALVPALDGIPVDILFSPGIQRNLDTAAPLSIARNIPITRRPQENPTKRLMRESAGKTVVWVGNKGNIKSIWESLALPEPAPLEYGDLYFVRSDAQGRVTVEQRRVEVP